MSFAVRVGYGELERRYFVLTSDIPGLHIEADSFEEFVEIAQDVAPDLIGEHAVGAKIKFEREVVLA
jgi:hypothetical protein